MNDQHWRGSHHNCHRFELARNYSLVQSRKTLSANDPVYLGLSSPLYLGIHDHREDEFSRERDQAVGPSDIYRMSPKDSEQKPQLFALQTKIRTHRGSSFHLRLLVQPKLITVAHQISRKRAPSSAGRLSTARAVQISHTLEWRFMNKIVPCTMGTHLLAFHLLPWFHDHPIDNGGPHLAVAFPFRTGEPRWNVHH